MRYSPHHASSLHSIGPSMIERYHPHLRARKKALTVCSSELLAKVDKDAEKRAHVGSGKRCTVPLKLHSTIEKLMVDTVQLLRRYTDLASALDIVKHRRVTLLPPSTWDDRNDRLTMDTYRTLKGYKTLLALCMSTRVETYHHWKVSAPGPTGVCIYFNRRGLTQAMRQPNMRMRAVKYLTIAKLRDNAPQAALLPFLKRSAFSDEGEYRFVYSSRHDEDGLKTVPIDLAVIERVSLSPWMPPTLAETIIGIIGELAPEAKFDVFQSKLIDNRSWRRFAKSFDPMTDEA